MESESPSEETSQPEAQSPEDSPETKVLLLSVPVFRSHLLTKVVRPKSQRVIRILLPPTRHNCLRRRHRQNPQGTRLHLEIHPRSNPSAEARRTLLCSRGTNPNHEC